MEAVQGATRSTVDSKTPHYNVSCQTCRISKTFFTLQGANAFFDEHEGHTVVEGRLFERPQAAKKPDVVVEAKKTQIEKPHEVVSGSEAVVAQEFKPPVEAAADAEVREEAQVEVVAEPGDVAEVSKPQVEEAPEVIEGSGEVIAQEVEPQVEEAPEVIESGEIVVQEPKPEVKDDPIVIEAPEVIAQEVTPQVEEAPEVIAASEDVIAQEVAPQVEDGADVSEPEGAQAPVPQVTQSTETQLKEPVSEPQPVLSEKDLEEPLLLARSSYIQESHEKRIDALRVSRALKEFKWNVEPPYVIGIMVDDNLSVETNIGVISSSMVERVQKLGYRFVAVNVPQGSPVAWFKREAQDSPQTNSPVGGAETMMQINQGNRTYDKDKAVWQESFVSLLMTVKDMDGQKLKRVTNIIRSDLPEPDLHS